jgi:hypothetical protein
MASGNSKSCILFSQNLSGDLQQSAWCLYASAVINVFYFSRCERDLQNYYLIIQCFNDCSLYQLQQSHHGCRLVGSEQNLIAVLVPTVE